MKILHMLFHPNLARSRVNRLISDQINKNNKIAKFKDMYKEYPAFKIDVKAEQQDLLNHDRIILQFPFYWYSSPPLLKQWFDSVLEYNFAYGPNGDQLHGKEMQLIISAGGSEDAYKSSGHNNFSILDFLLPIQQTAKLCGMHYFDPMKVYDAINIEDEKIIEYGKNFAAEIDLL